MTMIDEMLGSLLQINAALQQLLPHLHPLAEPATQHEIPAVRARLQSQAELLARMREQVRLLEEAETQTTAGHGGAEHGQRPPLRLLRGGR